MILFYIFVAVVLIVLGLFIITQGGEKLGSTVAAIGVVILLILLVSPSRGEEAIGHTHEGDVGRFYQSWMMPDSPKTSCCHDQDCSPAASRIVDGHWEAQRDGAWYSIPAYKIEQNRDSPDGRSHLCGRPAYGGGFSVFCFIAGNGA